MSHKYYDESVGEVLKELMINSGLDCETLARLLTIECLKLLPYSDRNNFFFPYEDYNSYATEVFVLTDKIIDNYINNVYHQPNSVIIFEENNSNIEKMLAHSITTNSVLNYLSGRTVVPALELLGFCRIFKISFDSFMNKVFDKFNFKWDSDSISEFSLEDAYNIFSKKAFGDRNDNRYVYNTNEQKHLLTSLFMDGKNELKLYFTYLPMNPGLKDQQQKTVIYQRGELEFIMKDGMCHVTSNVLIGSQGISSQYKGFAIIMNPKSNGTTCTCFLREVGNTFGVFVLFTFRLSPLDKYPRKTRISECMAVRKSDGTAFVYRLLISENYIDDEKMNYFAGHLKLCTSENTSDGKELNIMIKKKYIYILKQYFEGNYEINDRNSFLSDLNRHFGNVQKEKILSMISLLEKSYTSNDEVLTISPDIFNKKDTEQLLFMGWLEKYGLSARHDKIENSLDDEIENIHKILYPELHTDITDEWY